MLGFQQMMVFFSNFVGDEAEIFWDLEPTVGFKKVPSLRNTLVGENLEFRIMGFGDWM
jgi:hypothetical protein